MELNSVMSLNIPAPLKVELVEHPSNPTLKLGNDVVLQTMAW